MVGSQVSRVISMKIAIAQFNPVVGDIRGNVQRMGEFIDRASAQGAHLVVFGELSVVGYPPRDLLRKQRFVDESVAAVETLAGRCKDISALVGFVRPTNGDAGRPLQNAAALLENGKVSRVHVKTLLPTYDVFDETRYFEPGGKPECIEIRGRRIGLSICEDLWDADALGRQLYGQDPIQMLVADGAEFIVNMAASPYQMGKVLIREDLFARQARRHGVPIVYANQVGGNDELIFDGCSCVVDATGEVVARAQSFEEELLIVDMDDPTSAKAAALDSEIARVSAALKLGLGDYVRKCGFSSVVLGLSGGIDSAVVAVLAADALGPENVHAIAMPSRHSSDHSVSDAELLAQRTGINYELVAIKDIHDSYEGVLSTILTGPHAGTAAENIQARIRGNLVMVFSNAYGHLPLATGNKSELSVGYCTLYGDMCGGLAPIGDLLKTRVYELAEQLNREAGVDRVPRNTITKPPSAELKPGQVDQDKLPEYDVLDSILSKYVEQDMTAERIVAEGGDAKTVVEIVRMTDASEYKRKQAAPVLKVTARAFGSGRRMPIAQRYTCSKGE